MMRSARIWACAAFVASCLAGDGSTPQPLVIPASEHFEGNDGPWSTFDLRVGEPAQYLRVLVSTASPESIVALAGQGCSQAAFTIGSPPSGCESSRGNLFNPNQSSTWRDDGQFYINDGSIGLEANLGYQTPAQWGLDTVGLGLTGPNITNSTVGAVATTEPFYLGIFGLNNQPVNFTSLGNTSTPAFVTALKDAKQIPSLSWSYTAGAQYRLKQVYGQLIFSGYDTSRFEPNNVSFTMAGDTTRDLVVSLQQVSYSAGSTQTTLLSSPIDVFIDSTDPNLWLPDDVCSAFEKAFGLTLDHTSGMYLVNNTLHSQLLQTNASVSFKLSDTATGGNSVTVTLPYAAFDKTASAPLVATNSSYFPLRRAANATQYTLGRTFLQEAYLSADYERKVFNVSACSWDDATPSNIVAISSTDAPPPPSSSSGLSKGAIAGIAVGCSIAGLLIITVLVLLLLRKRRKWMGIGFAKRSKSPEASKSVLDGPVFNSETSNSPGKHSRSTPSSGMSWQGGSSTHYSPATANATPPRPPTINEEDAVAAAVGGGAVAGGTARPELDGEDTHVKPKAELDAEATQIGEVEGGPVAHNPGLYELPGSRVPHDVSSSTTTPSSPNVSTMDSAWAREHFGEGDDGFDPDQMVSPTSTYRGRRF